MKKVLFAGVAGLALLAGASANAAGSPRTAAATTPHRPEWRQYRFFSWTGCYIGANIGGAWTHDSDGGIAGGGSSTTR